MDTDWVSKTNRLSARHIIIDIPVIESATMNEWGEPATTLN